MQAPLTGEPFTSPRIGSAFAFTEQSAITLFDGLAIAFVLFGLGRFCAFNGFGRKLVIAVGLDPTRVCNEIGQEYGGDERFRGGP